MAGTAWANSNGSNNGIASGEAWVFAGGEPLSLSEPVPGVAGAVNTITPATGRVPAALSGRFMSLEAIESETCRFSNLVLFQFL